MPHAYSRSSSLNDTLYLLEPERVQYIDATAWDWVGTQLRRTEAVAERRGDEQVREFDRKWVMDRGMSGRRVLLKGLSPGMPIGVVKDMARGSGLIGGPDAVVPLMQYAIALPLWVQLTIGDRTPGRRHSMYALTVDSVANACRLARKLHMTHHSSPRGERLLLRAEVVW